MGEKYRDGDGVEADLEAARKWLQLASDQGHPEAKEALAELPLNADIAEIVEPVSQPELSETELSPASDGTAEDDDEIPYEGPPFHTAISLNDSAKVRSFLESGEDVDLLDEEKCNPLTVAVLYEALDVIPILVEFGADVNEEN